MKNWIHNESQDDIVLCSKVQVSRNIKDKKFITTIDKEEARELALDVYQNISNTTGEYSIIKSWETSQNELKYYKDREVVSSKFIDQKDKSAIVINQDETLSVMINEEDHIKIQGISLNEDIQESYYKVEKIDDFIHSKFNYEFDKKYGYLTCSSDNLGTGLKLSALVHIPALKLSNRISEIKDTLASNKISFNEVYKDANLFRITNIVTLGVTEKQIIDQYNQAICYLEKQENIYSEKLLSEKKLQMEDRIFRSYGLLSYARMLDPIESLRLLSDVRMGREMSILGISKSALNRAFIESRDSSIQRSLKEILSKEELDYKRAEIIRDNISKKI